MKAEWQDMELEGAAGGPVPVRVYKGASRERTPPLVLYLGASAFESDTRPEAERPVARALADQGAVVLEADYGGPSGNTFPQAMEFAFRALAGLHAERKRFGGARSRLFIAGEEAGGTVAAGVALKARDQMPGQLGGQMLLSPMIDPLMASTSMRRADEIGMRKRWSDGWRHYLRDACSTYHPYASPCLCSRLNGVAPALIMTAEDDPLRDETLAYSARLAGSGVDVVQETVAAGRGWTDLFRNGGGAWIDLICERFAALARPVKTCLYQG